MIRAESDWFARLRAHRLFMVLADNVRDNAVFLMDADGIIRYWGEGARLMKWWPKHQAEGSHLRMLYPNGGSEDGTAEGHLRVAAEFGEYTGEGRRVRSDGSTFWAGVTLTALKDDDGALLGFAKVTRDFTARRAVEAALTAGQAAVEGQRVAEEANRLKSQFVAMISHEIRAPLNALLGFVRLLTREEGGLERQSVHIARIQNSAGQLLEVMNDLLDISRLEAGRLSVKADAARLGAAVEAAVANVEAAASAKGVQLANAVSGAAADLPYWGDEARVRQIVINLLSNAVKFTPAEGADHRQRRHERRRRGRGALAPGPWIYLRVEDTGLGIPTERLDAIFEPFEQGRISDAHRGSGLGLSISRRLAGLMGGDLTVRSDVGSGSQFFLWLLMASSHVVPR
jgi:PAS domain S-box-containing protein